VSGRQCSSGNATTTIHELGVISSSKERKDDDASSDDSADPLIMRRAVAFVYLRVGASWSIIAQFIWSLAMASFAANA